MQIEFEVDKVWLSAEAVDFRKSINGLCAIVEENFKDSPDEGIYIFYNKGKNRLKILGWHGNGFILLYKRLEKGRFTIGSLESHLSLSSSQLKWLLSGLDWELLTNWDKSKFSNYF